MIRLPASLRQRLEPWWRPLADARRWPLYLLRRAAGDVVYVLDPRPPPGPFEVEVKLPADGATAVNPEQAAAWCDRQTLGELRAVGYGRAGQVLWRVDRQGLLEKAPGTVPWFMAPGRLPELYPAFVESAALLAAAETVDAVLLRERIEVAVPVLSVSDLVCDEHRPHCLYRAGIYSYDAARDAVRALRPRLVKVVESRGASGGMPEGRKTAERFRRSRRGPYLSPRRLPPRLRVGVRDVAAQKRAAVRRASWCDAKRKVLVTAPFLARGGAEHTLFETLKVLRDRFDFLFATLAPHRPELGDRRSDFREISERIYCLGDLVHPAAMPGILVSLIETHGIEILYNANSTTLFYDFAPRLKAERPALRILDHLYDHRVGYIERYRDRALLSSVDACVAENQRIARVLTEERSWPAARVPVIWPCGRPRAAFPADPGAVRAEVRAELGLARDDIVFLAAARMHEQKRPLDLVALAKRFRDRGGVRFLVAGGGDLDDQVDAAIAASGGAPIRRLGFRTDIPRLIAAADVGCLVSQYEGLPVFLLECLQSGKPFLGTDVGDLGAVLRATGAGLVVDRPGDLEALAGAVEKLLDPAVRADLSTRAAAAGEEFDVETCAERYAAALEGGAGS